MTKSEIIKAIHEDYDRVVGKVIFPLEVDGYLNSDSVVMQAMGLHPFEVLNTMDSDLERPMGDGCWDVKPLYPEEFQQAVREAFPEASEAVRLVSMWVYGHSYREGSSTVLRSKLRFVDTFTMGGPAAR